ncbi:putative ABC transport system permease protein [Rhabdobacter roseus]|uniref:Putative ABC transport system permease protein n=1 Tax=Rhabdobacter roseus TaxID=1655419 RepID=A0A840TKF0_9BACT|nr:permease prefix domain 2-containing transporter [Rhabdobacter roseus]MBB5283415.1 putative ABC transport system permease protein [Rhabdobacter roseus]
MNPKSFEPPRWLDRLLNWLVAPHLREEVLGDLHERYARRVRRLGERRARSGYWREVLAYLRPRFIKRQPNPYPQPNQTAMIRNYLKIAWRTLSRNKLYTALNVAGLTFGISCFLLIGLYLFDELTFDQQHSQAKRIYRAIQHKKTPTDELTIAASSYKVSEESRKSIGEIENSARILRTGRANLTNPENKNTFQETVMFANAGLMKVFDFEAVDGDTKTGLDEPNSIVLVEELAQRLFNSTQVVGKTVEFEFFSNKPLTITAVLKNHPRNSSFDFKLAVSEATISNTDDFAQWTADWAAQDFMTFFLLKEQARPSVVADKITQLLTTNAKLEPGTSLNYSLQPLADIHLYSEGIVDSARNSNVEAMSQGVLLYVKIFAIVALFVLLIACINYMNLATARASNRSKEIGVRKASGAFQSHIIHQFLTESLVVTIISFVLALMFVNVLLPSFNAFTNKELSLGIHTDYRIWLYAFLALVVTGLLSGSYPSLLLSRFKPLSLLKNLKTQPKGSWSIRQGLVVFQFTISVVMMVATIVLFQQVRFATTKNLGFNQELLLVVDINSRKIRSAAETIKTEFSRIPSVQNVAATSRVPGEWKMIPTVKIREVGKTEEHQIAYLIGADENFARTFEVQLLNGRNFAGKGDSASVLLNETAARLLGITQATEQLVEIPSRAMAGNYQPLNDDRKPFSARVVGIVKDFHFQSLREKIAPMVLAYENNPVHPIDYYTARIEGEDIPATLEKMNAVLTHIDPTHLLEYHFLDEQLARFYAEDQRRGTLLIWVALATIFIACLGLFGLATYAAEQRIKEIGVRKVLGASIFNLTALLSKDFLKLVFIANGIAFPLAWWATSKWLEEFAYHIQPAWWVFAVSGILSVAIALATVSFQAIRAALMNPAKSLQSE